MALRYQWEPADPFVVNSDSRTFEAAELPFYRTVRLLRAQKNPPSEGYDYYLRYDAGTIKKLDGRSDFIHDANDYERLALTAFNVKEYLKFFCYFINAENGNFYVFDDKNDSALTDGTFEIDFAAASRIEPIQYLRTDEDGAMYFSAYVHHNSSLFFAEFQIRSRGYVEMVDDEMIWSKT